MAVRDITITGHRALHQPTKKVREITDETRELVRDMFDTMEAAEGVGLAANQVGIRLRLFVYDCPGPDEARYRGVVVNPVLERLGVPEPLDEDLDSEGCLSVPGEYFPLARHPRARVIGTDLDGVLYVDRLTGPWKREAREAIKDRGWANDGTTKWDPATMKAEDI